MTGLRRWPRAAAAALSADVDGTDSRHEHCARNGGEKSKKGHGDYSRGLGGWGLRLNAGGWGLEPGER